MKQALVQSGWISFHEPIPRRLDRTMDHRSATFNICSHRLPMSAEPGNTRRLMRLASLASISSRELPIQLSPSADGRTWEERHAVVAGPSFTPTYIS